MASIPERFAMATSAEALVVAKRHLQSGDLRQAEIIYRQILQADSSQAEAVHFLGVITFQLGNNDAGMALLKQSVAIAPGNAGFYFNLGSAYQKRGQLDEALASYQEAVRLQPDFAEAHNSLGNALGELGQLDLAAVSYQRALSARPHFAEVHYNLANTQKKLGQVHAAVGSYKQAVHHKPDYAEAHCNLANLYLDANNLDDAVKHYLLAVKFNPNDALGHNNLANALRMQGRWTEAKASFRLALSLQPDFAEAHYNLGQLFLDLAQFEEAVACYTEAIRLKPGLADAHASLASALAEQGRTREAVAKLEQALRLNPSARLQIALATCQPVISQSVAEMECWRGHLVKAVAELCEQEIVHDVTEEPAAILFYLPYQGLNGRDIQRDVARLHRAPISDFRFSIVDRRERRRIRMGFLSSFFRRHTIGLLMGGLVKELSRKDFEVVVLSVGRHEDAVAGFFKHHADRFVEIPRHLPAARRLIAEAELDVLLYTDIGMDPVTSTLAYSRLAPIQCTTWGHPVTTGIDTIDYFLSSEALETDEADQHYSETLVRLKNLPIYYYRPELPQLPQGREAFGLGPEVHVYACPQSLFKLHPDFDAVLGGILRADPQGTVLLISGRSAQWEHLLRQRFEVTLADVVNRVRFLPRLNRPEFLNLMAVSDVLLDPLHFGGGNTSYEGLALGVPIVTLPSRFLRGRITFALYKQMGMLDCVVQSPEEYIALALRLGTDKRYRDQVRDRILEGNGVLYENSAGVKELEEFFKAQSMGSTSRTQEQE
jgi:protein O-GlcNAc transferase